MSSNFVSQEATSEDLFDENDELLLGTLDLCSPPPDVYLGAPQAGVDPGVLGVGQGTSPSATYIETDVDTDHVHNVNTRADDRLHRLMTLQGIRGHAHTPCIYRAGLTSPCSCRSSSTRTCSWKTSLWIPVHIILAEALATSSYGLTP